MGRTAESSSFSLSAAAKPGSSPARFPLVPRLLPVTLDDIEEFQQEKKNQKLATNVQFLANGAVILGLVFRWWRVRRKKAAADKAKLAAEAEEKALDVVEPPTEQ